MHSEQNNTIKKENQKSKATMKKKYENNKEMSR